MSEDSRWKESTDWEVVRMMRTPFPDHPDIARCLETGYPWMREEDDEEGDEDRFYEEARDAVFDFWED